MVVEVFSVVPSPSVGIYMIFIAPVAIAILAVGSYMNTKSIRQLLVLIVVVIAVFAGSYAYIHYKVENPSEITIGNGFIQISSSETGTMNFTSGQISSAYVAHIGSGNLSLSRIHGLYNSVDRVGVFSMGNGATAYVVSDVPNDLIVELTSGNYLIVGNSNLSAMVSLFNQEVYPG